MASTQPTAQQPDGAIRRTACEVLASDAGPYIATLDDLSQATGIAPRDLRIALTLPDSCIEFEQVYGEEFILKDDDFRAPGEIGPVTTMWTLLRTAGNMEQDQAYTMWRQISRLSAPRRDLVINPGVVRANLGGLGGIAPVVGLRSEQPAVPVFPVLASPQPHEVGHPEGLLSQYAKAGANGVAILCDSANASRVKEEVGRWQRHHAPRPVDVCVIPTSSSLSTWNGPEAATFQTLAPAAYLDSDWGHRPTLAERIWAWFSGWVPRRFVEENAESQTTDFTCSESASTTPYEPGVLDHSTTEGVYAAGDCRSRQKSDHLHHGEQRAIRRSGPEHLAET